MLPGHDYLEEIPEAEADGKVAAVYADIRRVLGVPFVMLFYRALALDPIQLSRIWAELAPNIADPLAARVAAELGGTSIPGVTPVPQRSFDVVRLDRERAAATLRCYRRANSANIVGLHALLEGVDAPPANSPARSAAQRSAPILPLAKLEELAPRTRHVLEEMSVPITGGEAPVIIPGLLRHFAHDPSLPVLLWDAIRAAALSAEFAQAVASLGVRASNVAGRLPYRVTRVDDPGTRALIDRFLRTIPAMIVTGSLIEQALREILGDSAGT